MIRNFLDNWLLALTANAHFKSTDLADVHRDGTSIGILSFQERPFPSLEAIRAAIVKRLGTLKLVPDFISVAISKSHELVSILNTGLFLKQRVLTLQLRDLAYKLHLFKLGLHQLFLQLHKALSKVEHSTPNHFLISQSNQALTDVLSRIRTSYSCTKPLKHKRAPLQGIWHCEISTVSGAV